VLVTANADVRRTTDARGDAPAFTTTLATRTFGMIPVLLHDFAFAPSLPTTGWATRDLHQMLRSDDLQSGAPTWTSMSSPGQRVTGQPIVHVTIDPADPQTVYAATATTETTVTPSSGSGSASISVAVTSAGGVPAAGSYTGSVRLSVAGSSNGVAPVRVTLSVTAGTSGFPVGAFETPAAGSALQGSVAVSGWALDDIGVDRVELWRDLQAGETTPPFASTSRERHDRQFRLGAGSRFFTVSNGGR
jgi:hypothetical protein